MKFSTSTPFSVSPPWVLFSLFQLKAGNRFWAFKTRGRVKHHLSSSSFMPFGVMLGTGGGRGFLLPNWQQYALLTCWNKAEDAINFMKTAPIAQEFQQRSQEAWSVLMQPVVSKGSWGGDNPFAPLAEPLLGNEPVVVLTRASIRLSRLPEFLSYVPRVSRTTDSAPGLLVKTGIGELPLIEQATLSVWQNQQSVDNFAYKMQEHKQVVAKTRQRDWYKEELFARFRPLQSWGTLNGRNPLAPLQNKL